VEPTNRSPEVDAFLREVDHPLFAEVQRLRLAILAGIPELTESIKWKAPSFRFGDVDRVTFNLRPFDVVQLVFHRGVAKRSDVDAFEFADQSGLITWITPDRGIVTLEPIEAVEREADLVDLIGRWIRV
jgi:hypothetical protein